MFYFLKVVRIVPKDDTKETKDSENDDPTKASSQNKESEAKGSDGVGSNVDNKKLPQNEWFYNFEDFTIFLCAQRELSTKKTVYFPCNFV